MGTTTSRINRMADGARRRRKLLACIWASPEKCVVLDGMLRTASHRKGIDATHCHCVPPNVKRACASFNARARNKCFAVCQKKRSAPNCPHRRVRGEIKCRFPTLILVPISETRNRKFQVPDRPRVTRTMGQHARHPTRARAQQVLHF